MSQVPLRQTRRKKGCDICRSKKVKCDEKQPTCARCNRLKLTCSWPRLELTLQAKRRGYGSLKSRERHNCIRKDAEERESEKDIWSPRPILPALTNTSGIDRNRPDTAAPAFPSTTSLTMDSSLESDDWLETAGVENDNFTWDVSSNCAENLLPLNGLPPNFEELEQFLSAINTGVSWSPGMGSAFPHSLSDHHLPLANSMVLSSEEHNALGHYQTTFSIYRTTKDPKWSTHKLLLDLGSQNTMIMHFILAVSINDVCHRHENHPGSQEAQLHFQAGALELIETIKNPEANYKFLMAAFLFLYLYMPKRKSVSRHRIKDLSKTVLEYIKRHRLDAQCLDSDDSLDNSSLLTDRERSVLARLIIWTYDEDVKCGFQGSGGHLAGYLTSHRERTMAVYEVSRTALGAHWGSQYPDSQIADDDDNAMELEMLWALTTLWQDINDLSQGLIPDGVDIHRRIKLRFNLLEKKYASVFARSAIPTIPRTRVLINADYDVVLFNALRIYYFRTTCMDPSVASPPPIQIALKNLLSIVQRSFVSSRGELHDRLQWPLFLAGIETDDGIYKEWILSRITKNRARAALQQTIDIQGNSGKRLGMGEIRSLLYDSDAIENFGVPVSQDSFFETITES